MPIWLLVLFGAAVGWLVLRVWQTAGNRRAGTGSGDQATQAGWEDDGPNRTAVLGPDQTNVNPPESYVVHHEGKGQGMDIANRALKELTDPLTADAPGETPVHAQVPGRAMVVEEDVTGTSRREGTGGRDLDDGKGPGGRIRAGVPDDGTAGRRVAASPHHIEAAAQLAYPYRPAPFIGSNKRRLRRHFARGSLRLAQREMRRRVLDVANRLKRGPLPSHPLEGDLDPAHGGASGDRPQG